MSSETGGVPPASSAAVTRFMSRNLMDLFAEASEISGAGERAAFLDSACEGNAELRARVEKLLGAHAQVGTANGFLGGPEGPDGSRLAGTEAASGEVGRYKLLQKIGEGGWGIVYMAEQTVPVRRRVALKIIKPGMDSRQVLARFEAERQALAMMDHPHIARVLDAGATENGRPYFVMELVRGIPITHYCDKNRLTMRERLELFIQVCQAVQHAHQKGIIHRDIKPSNILVTSDDGKPLPKVIDFGVAKATTDIRLTDKTLFTRFEMFVGTPAYMSPEQAEFSAQGVDTRTDIYALGVLLYELLTGQTPFDGQTLISSGVDAMRRTIREVEPPKPSTRLRLLEMKTVASVAAQRQSEQEKLVAQIRGDLDWIVLKALEKDRTRRYESAVGMALDVRRYLDVEPVTARPPSAFYAFRKWTRRHRAMFLGGTAVVASLILGTVISLWLAMRARTAEQEQRELRSVADIARQEAQDRAAESRRQLMQLNVSSGNRLAETGACHQALLWFVEAMRLVQGDPVAEDIHRRRYAALRRFSPRLDYLAPMDGGGNLWFSPDGRKVIGMSGGGLGFLREAEGGKLLAEGPVTNEWLLGQPGSRLADGSAGLAFKEIPAAGGFMVLDAFAGRDTGMRLECPPEVGSIVFSRDGRRAAATDGKSKLYCWHLPEGKPVIREPDVSGSLLHLSISGDGSRLAALTRGVNYDLTVWDFEAGVPLLDLRNPAGDIMVCRISPDGKQVAAGSWDGYARIYDVASGQTVGDAMRHGRGVATAVFTPDGSRLVTTSWDSTLRVWDAATGQPASPSLYSAGYVPVLRISPDGKRMAAFSLDQNTRVWDISRTGAHPRLSLRHGDTLTAAAISPDARLIASAGRDAQLRLWNAADGAPLTSVPQTALVVRTAFSPDSRLLAAGFADGRVELLDAATGAVVRTTAGHTGTVHSLAFNSDGALLVSTGVDEMARIWNTADAKAHCPPLRHEGGGILASFSRDGRRVLTYGRDGSARIWDTDTGAARAAPIRQPGEIFAAAFHPDGTRIITAPSDYTQDARSAQIWNAATGQPSGPPLPHRDGVLYAGFSPDGKWAASASEDGAAIVWDAATGSPVTPPMRHLSYVWRAGFSPDSQLLLTASMDKTARVWDALTGEPVTPPLPHGDQVMEAEWIAGGREVFTFSLDGIIRIWDVSPAAGTLDELQREAELLSSQRLVPGLGVTPLTVEEIRERWRALRPDWK